jgi:hypothetical protein
VVAQLYRGTKDGILSIDLKSGYVVYSGSWTLRNGDSIEIKSRVVDSYKYVQTDSPERNGSSDVWMLSGTPIGSLKRTLTRDGVVFEATNQLRGVNQVLDFWSQFAPRR